MKFTAKIAEEYERLFYSAQIKPALRKDIDAICEKIVDNHEKYGWVSTATGVPWHFIACVHLLECSLDFSLHLHNGDPLTARTVRVPAGRPVQGAPPFSWFQSAVDAIRYEGYDKVPDWTLARSLYLYEGFNGYGYRSYKINTPYLWAGTQHYTRGKFVRDGVFSATAVSRQIGIVCVTCRLAELGVLPAEYLAPDSTSADGPVRFGDTGAAVLALQRRLNATPGILLREDGIAGARTSDAYFRVYGVFLPGDSRRG